MENVEDLENLATGDQEQLDADAAAAAQEKMKLLIDSYRRAQPAVSVPGILYFFAFLVIFGSVGFFAYKLFNSLREKERKREEKKKLKEAKKKK